MTAKSKTPRTAKIDYAELSAELAAIMSKLEAGELEVDAAVDSYERGLEIVKLLETHLTEAENRVSELKAASAGLYASEEE